VTSFFFARGHLARPGIAYIGFFTSLRSVAEPHKRCSTFLWDSPPHSCVYWGLFSTDHTFATTSLLLTTDTCSTALQIGTFQGYIFSVERAPQTLQKTFKTRETNHGCQDDNI